MAEDEKAFKAFVDLFNREKYFEAHEVLEWQWRRESGAERDFYQGLIQIAAVFVHLRKGTPEGGQRLYQTASLYLKKYGTSHKGLDLSRLLRETKTALSGTGTVPKIALSKN